MTDYDACTFCLLFAASWILVLLAPAMLELPHHVRRWRNMRRRERMK